MDELEIILDSGDKGDEKRAKRGKRSAPPPKVTHTSRARWGWIIVLGIVIAAVVLGLQLADQNRIQPQPGEAAPDFTLTTYGGETILLSALRGKIVVVNFWANWCPPCHDEAPDFKAISDDYSGKNVVFVGINWLEPSEADALGFIARYGLTYANGPDLGEKIAQSYRITAAPETYVVNRNGIVADTIIGPTTYEHLAEVLDGLIGAGGAS